MIARSKNAVEKVALLPAVSLWSAHYRYRRSPEGLCNVCTLALLWFNMYFYVKENIEYFIVRFNIFFTAIAAGSASGRRYQTLDWFKAKNIISWINRYRRHPLNTDVTSIQWKWISDLCRKPLKPLFPLIRETAYLGLQDLCNISYLLSLLYPVTVYKQCLHINRWINKICDHICAHVKNSATLK